MINTCKGGNPFSTGIKCTGDRFRCLQQYDPTLTNPTRRPRVIPAGFTDMFKYNRGPTRCVYIGYKGEANSPSHKYYVFFL